MNQVALSALTNSDTAWPRDVPLFRHTLEKGDYADLFTRRATPHALCI